MPLRGLIRSETTPNTGDNRKVGSSMAALTIPTQVAVPVSAQALQPSRKRSTQLASVDRQLDQK